MRSKLRHSTGIERMALWLQRVKGRKQRYSLAVTSVKSGEGVTHVVCELAHYLSCKMDFKIITIDIAGMGSLIKLLGADEERILGASCNLHPCESEGLFVLSEKSLPASINRESLSGLLCSIEDEGDFLILDAPHVFEEGFTGVAASVDGVLLILDTRITNREEATAAVASIKESGSNEIGVVMNRKNIRVKKTHKSSAVCQMSGSGDFEIRRMTEDDRPAVLELVRSVWGSDLTRSKMIQWEWLYGRNPNNPPEGPRAMIVKDRERVVGLFRCIPVPFKVGDQYFVNDWNVDLMIHSDYREKGLALELSRALLSEGDVNTGLPLTNSPTYKILAKLNGRFMDVAPFHQIIRPIRMYTYARSVLKLPVISHVFAVVLKLYFVFVIDRRKPDPDEGLLVEETREFDDSFDDFWEEVQWDYPVIVKRDSRYLTWKFIERPDCSYRIYTARRGGKLAGYVVTRSDVRFGVRTGFIVDILTHRDDMNAIDMLLTKAIRHLRDDNVDQISAQTFYVPSFKRSFRKMGFLKKPSRKVRRIVLTINNDAMPRNVLTNRENWFITRNYAHQEM